VINLINVIYVVKDLVGIIAYRIILEHIQVIQLIHVNVMYVVKDSVMILPYRDTLEYTLVINLIYVIYVVKDLECDSVS
jgi:hypothetical protein